MAASMYQQSLTQCKKYFTFRRTPKSPAGAAMNAKYVRLVFTSLLLSTLTVVTGRAAGQGRPQDPAVAAEIARAHAGVAQLGREWNAEVLAATTHLYLPLHRQ